MNRMISKSPSEPERASWPQAPTKRVLLQLATFFLLFNTTHWLLMWLHPMGAHRFFLNLALGGLTSWILVSLLVPRGKGYPAESEHQQDLHH